MRPVYSEMASDSTILRFNGGDGFRTRQPSVDIDVTSVVDALHLNMFEDQLGSERRFLDLWLENNFPDREASETRSLWSIADSSRAGDWQTRDGSQVHSWEAGPSSVDSWQNTTKSFQVLTFLCSELQLLEGFAHKKFYPMLYVVGGTLIRSHTLPMGDLELQLATFIPTLQDVLDYLSQLEALVENLLSQTCAILLDDTMEIKRRVVSTALRCASRGLTVLFCIQTLITIKILPLFFTYRRMLHTMMSKSTLTDKQRDRLEDVQDQVVRLEESLRLGAFTTFVDSRIKHGVLGKHFQKKSVSTTIEQYFVSQIETCTSQLDLLEENVLARSDLLATMLLFVAFCWSGTFPKDKRVIRSVLEIHQKAPSLPLYYSLVVVPARFLHDVLPSSHLSHLPWDYAKQCSVQSAAYLQTLQKSISGRIERISFRGAVWATELYALLGEGEGVLSAADREQFLTLLTEGLQMMKYLSQSFESIVQLHVEQSQPMNKETLRSVTTSICHLKLISGHIARSWQLVEANLDFFREHYKSMLLEVFKKAYDHLTQLERSDQTRHMRRVLSRLSGSFQQPHEHLNLCVKLVKMGIQSLQEKATPPQRILLHFIVDSISGFPSIPDFFEVESLQCLKQMETAEMMDGLLQMLGRCELLYLHPELMRNALEQLLRLPEEARKLPHLVNGFLDIHFLAEDAGMGHAKSVFVHDISSMLKVYFIDPLSRVVQQDLLGSVQANVSPQRHRTETGIDYRNNVLPLLQLEPLSLIGRDLKILDSVKVQLSRALRKLTIQGELRWETLCRIKNTAQEKYGIVLDSPEPSEGCTPSSLDHLYSRDGIQGFVASYMFQLHSFTFVLSPRTPSNPYHDLPEVVGIEDFMDLVQADITQVGPVALAALMPMKEERARSDQDLPTAGAESVEPESAGDGNTPRSKSDDGMARQECAPSDGRVSAFSNFMVSFDSFKPSASIPEGSILNPGRSHWSFLKSNHDMMYFQESVGSETSLQPAPRSSDGQTREGRVTVIIRDLVQALSVKLHHVVELCAAAETRSVLSQTTRRWQNSQKAVGNQYPVAQAELVRKEVIALLKAGTLRTNIIHKLRFLVGDVGKVVSMVMLLFHGASRVREGTFAMIPKQVRTAFDSLGSFLNALCQHEKIVQEATPFDQTLGRLDKKTSVHAQYMQLLEKTFEQALDDTQLELLRNLFILAPAMSMDHIESMRSLKNQYQGGSLNKITANTEDSFAVGLSFLLSFLNQMTKFEAFHWFDSAERHYRNRLDRVKATSINQPSNVVSVAVRRTPDVEVQRNMEVIDSLHGSMVELKLLEHSMYCGKVLFWRGGSSIDATPN